MAATARLRAGARAEQAIDKRPFSIIQSTFHNDCCEQLAAEVPMNVSPMKQPSAWLPIAMSGAALALVLGHIGIYGIVREADEGTAAHLWQLLMAGRVPAIMY